MRSNALLRLWMASVLLLLSLMESQPAAAQQGNVIRYVRAGAPASGSCTSWAAACELQHVLAIADRGDEVRVAAGAYYPTAGSSRSATFSLPSGVALYGGYPANGGEPAQRSWQVHLTILSGDIGTAGDAGDNSYHVVSSGNTHPLNPTVLDGFLITGGNANGNRDDAYGGGIYNSGGSPRLANLIIAGNRAAGMGAGMYNRNGSPALVNVTLIDNRIDCTGECLGAGMYNQRSSPTLTNLTFYNNRIECASGACQGSGGAISSRENSHPVLSNCILWGNDAPLDAQIDGEAALSYSDVQGGWSGEGNLNADPLFVDAASGNLRLQGGSPAIDAGSSDLVPPDAFDLDGDGNTAEHWPYDLDGSPRLVDFPGVTGSGSSSDGDARVDMGAYEAQIGFPRLFVNQRSAGRIHDGASWATAFTDLQPALSVPGAQEIWVAAGTYYPGPVDFRAATFRLRSGLGLFGGFAGYETSLSQRGAVPFSTVLSGDLNRNGQADNDAYHVVTASGVDGSAVLDGFKITMGLATGSGQHGDAGGGILVIDGQPQLTNLHITGNQAAFGAGVYSASATGAGPALTNVTFSDNQAVEAGGGLFTSGGDLTLTSATFSQNEAGTQGGGLLNSGEGQLTLTNVTFFQNHGGAAGGGIYSQDGSGVTLVNSILWGNTGGESAQLYGAAAVSYSDIELEEGIWEGESNLNQDPRLGPLLAYPGGAARALGHGSPAIDAGSPETCPATEHWSRPLDGDRDGSPRCDMGMYEYPPHWLYLPLTLRLTGGG